MEAVEVEIGKRKIKNKKMMKREKRVKRLLGREREEKRSTVKKKGVDKTYGGDGRKPVGQESEEPFCWRWLNWAYTGH